MDAPSLIPEERPYFLAWQDRLSEWLTNEVITPETAYQLILIALVLAFSWLVHKAFDRSLVKAINNLQIMIRLKQMLHNLRRMVPVFISLVIFLGFSMIDAIAQLQIQTNLIEAAGALLLAWAIIRLALFIVRNSFFSNIIAVIIWAIAALSILGLIDETSAALDALAFSFGELRLSALSVIKGLFLLAVLLYFAILSSSLIEKKIRTVSGLTMTSKVLIGKVVRVVLIVFALLIAVTSAGIDLSLFAVFSGAVGLGVGFGLQKGISNLFSGMLLLMDKSIKPGDIIELQTGTGAFGWVNHMGARYTEIITRDNKSFLIPNEDFITQQVINWSHGDTLVRTEVDFGVHYNSDPHEVIRISREAATHPERVVDEPKPVCWLTEFGDSSLNFKLRFWIKDAENGVTNIKGQVMLSLWDAFKENNILIPYPHREVFIHNDDNAAAIPKKKPIPKIKAKTTQDAKKDKSDETSSKK